MASTIQVDTIKDIGGNTMISSNGSGTFTSNLPASSGEIVAAKIVTFNPASGISTTSASYTEATSSLRLTHALSNSSNKLIFYFSTMDAYCDAGIKGAVGIGKSTDTTANIIASDKPILLVKGARGAEVDNATSFVEYSPGATTSFTYCILQKVASGSGTFYIQNTTSTGSLRFNLLEIQA